MNVTAFPHVVLLLSIGAALSGCLGLDAGAENPEVLATFYPLGFLATRIAGDNLTVGTFVPAGVEPHDWEPSARDVARLAGARVYLAQGAGFEPWLDGMVGSLGGNAPPVVETTDGLPLMRGGDDHGHDDEEGGEQDAAEEEGEWDPHTWLDPVLFAEQARIVERALSERFPEHAHSFGARADALVADLEALDEDYATGLATCEERVVIANHDAFTYPATRYEFDVLAISGLAPESEPDPRTVARLVEEAREHNVTIIFFEELVSPRVAEIIANEVGAETRVLSPLEGLTPEASSRGDDYVSVMRANLVNLRDAMRCE